MWRFVSLSGWNRSVDGAASRSASMGSITEQAWPHPMLRLSTDLGFRDPHPGNLAVAKHPGQGRQGIHAEARALKTGPTHGVGHQHRGDTKGEPSPLRGRHRVVRL